MLYLALVALGVDEGVGDVVVRPVQLAREEGVGEAGLGLLAGCGTFLWRGRGGSLGWVSTVLVEEREGQSEERGTIFRG